MEIIQPYRNKIQVGQVLLISFGILGFQMISYLPELLGVESRIISVPYRFVYFLICLFVLFRYRVDGKIGKPFLPVFIFIFIYLLRSIFDTLYKYQELNSILVEFWLFAFLVGFLPIFPLLFKVNSRTINRAKQITFLLAMCTNFISFISNYSAVTDEKLGARLLGNEIINPITYGQTGVVLVLICLTYFYDPKFKFKLLLFPLIAIGLMNLALAGSRGPMIELAITVTFFLLFNVKKIGIKKLIVFFLFMIGIAVYFSSYLIFFNTAIDRIQETGFNQGSGSEERFFLVTEAWNHIKSSPVFGYQAIGVYPHNLILEAFLAVGFLGGALMVYITYLSFSNCFVLLSNNSTNWVSLIFMLHLISTFFSGALWNSFEFWSLLALTYTLKKNYF